MTNKVKHLHEIKGRFAVRVSVPLHLRSIVFVGGSGSELREWLGSDRKAAERATPEIVARFYGIIDKAAAEYEAAKVASDAADFNVTDAAKRHYAAEMLLDDLAGGAAPARAFADLNLVSIAAAAPKLRAYVAGGLSDEEAEALVGYAVDDAVAAGVASEDLARSKLLRAMAHVQLDLLAAKRARAVGEVLLPDPRSELLHAPAVAPIVTVRPVDTPPPIKPPSGKSLEDVMELFHKERMSGGRSLAEGTMKEHRVAIRMFAEVLGEASPDVSRITVKDIRDFKNALLEAPANYAARFPGRTLPSAIEANKQRSEPHATLNATTINDKWLAHLATILGWAFRNGFIDANPAQGVKVDQGKGYKEPTRVPFTPEDLQKIFGSELFASPEHYGTQQWALLIALYTGARSSSEIARIKLADLYQEQGIWVFDLEEATKNVHSKRLVPVHAVLLELGLLQYVKRLEEAGHARLFWDWEPEDKINRWFLRTYKKQVGIEDVRKVFHSFRHTLKTALARHGVNRDVSDLITGHKDQSVGGVYIGNASTTMIESMKVGLDSVSFGFKMGTLT